MQYTKTVTATEINCIYTILWIKYFDKALKEFNLN